jgi:SAM-dependent methyltransferase
MSSSSEQNARSAVISMSGVQTIHREIQIEDVLHAHPGVQTAAVVRDDSNTIWAFVVSNDEYMDDILGRTIAGSTVVGKWRKAYDLSQLTKEAASAPAGFNTIGWNSSYTRQPIPREEIREWVEATVADILRLAPKKVYEVGCGTGMLLMRIAPHCDRYVAADFSPAVLARLNQQLTTTPALAERVQVMERRADNFNGLDQNSFDTVVLSSVVQYFPNSAYLTRVLENAVNVVRPGGHVYVGDIRSLPLLPAFASSVELFQAADEMSAEELRDRVRRRLQREQELVLSPMFFLALQRRFPKISDVEIRPLRGHARNEMLRYRFQAILHVGCDRETSSAVEFLDWNECRWSVDEIRSRLRQYPNETIGMKRIRNSRIEKDLEAFTRIDATNTTFTAVELRRDLGESIEAGIDPQALFELEAEVPGHAVFLSWAACRPDGTYDALLVPAQALPEVPSPAACWPQPEASDLVRVANAPGQSKIRSDLINQLVMHCVENHLDEMSSTNIVLVDTLPRTPDDDVDVLALLAARSASYGS